MTRALVLATSALLIGLASPAWADKDKDKGGKGKHGQGRGGPAVVDQPVRVVVPDHDRAIVYQYYRSEFSAGRCPPGLAKKGNGCLPPGQAKKLYGVGQRWPTNYGYAWNYNQIPNDLRTRYAFNPDYRYYYGDGYLYRVDPRTMLISQVVSAVLR